MTIYIAMLCIITIRNSCKNFNHVINISIICHYVVMLTPSLSMMTFRMNKEWSKPVQNILGSTQFVH